ncbi:head maturation protease, ClpP-related [Bosea sp. MMO-172]|uniref:head maturation protease, ClpP-related n=1 Tax=Bosea sp. MMO-172 TaxID=3127885 RepID=UPI003019C8B9
MAVLVDGNELVLTGTVGAYWFEDGFTAAEVSGALARLGRETDIVARLNSGGGIATEGTAIHAAFAAHKGKVDIVVEGIAASAASIIAMAGDSITMALGAVMMIHDASTIAFGDAGELQKRLGELDAISGSMASIYADRTGKPAAEMRDLMKAETWFTAEDAVEAGFADAVGGAAAAERSEPSAFAYRSYAHAPAPVLALADARGWTVNKLLAASAAPIAQTREKPMSATPKADDKPADLDKIRADAAADAVKADRDRRSAIMALDEAKGREALADHLYLTGATVDAAKAALAVAPKAAAAAPDHDYDAERARASGLAQPGAAHDKSRRAGVSAHSIYAARRTAHKGA